MATEIINGRPSHLSNSHNLTSSTTKCIGTLMKDDAHASKHVGTENETTLEER